MALTHHYIDKIVDIQQQLLPILQVLDNDKEKQFKKYILNKKMEPLSNIIHNIDNIMLEIIKLKFACQSFCNINNRDDLLSLINLDEDMLKDDEIKDKLQNDKESQEVINKFIPIMMYYSMMKKSNNKNINDDNGDTTNSFGPAPKVDLTHESEQYD
jgi:hypothetical protein